MKKSFALAMFLVIVGFGTTAFSDCSGTPNPLLCEDWETGSIDTSLWQEVGSPSPKIYSSGHNSNYSVNVNGDNWCDSGFYSKDTFDTQSNLTAEFALKGSQTSSSTCMGIKAGFTSESRKEGQSCNPSSEPPGLYNYLAYVYLDPQAGRTRIRYVAGVEYFDEPYPDNNWHQYKVEMQSEGTVKFYRDGALKWTTTIDLSGTGATRFQSQGRACYGPMLIDDIMIFRGVSVELPHAPSLSATAGTGGMISPSGVVTLNEGANQTFTIIPLNGYQISEVLVDGVSQGAISTYTFSNTTGNHTISATFKIVNPGTLPGAPTLSVTTSGAKVTLSWSSVTSATGYTLYFAPYPDASYIGQIDMKTQTRVSFTLWEGLAFYVAVRSYNSSGLSDFSNITYFIIHEVLPADNSRFYGNFYGMNTTGNCVKKLVFHFGNDDAYKQIYSYLYLPDQGTQSSYTCYVTNDDKTWTINRNLSISGNTISIAEQGTSNTGDVWSFEGTAAFSSDYSKVVVNGRTAGGLCDFAAGTINVPMVKADCTDTTPPFLVSTEARPNSTVAFNFSKPMELSSWWYSMGCGGNEVDYWEDLDTYIVIKPTCAAGETTQITLNPGGVPSFRDVCGNVLPETQSNVTLK